jgi:hypothetical protein
MFTKRGQGGKMNKDRSHHAPSQPEENWLMKPALEWLEQAEHGGEKERCQMIADLLRDLWRRQAPPSEITPPIVAHSKTEYKRLKEQGANVLPPASPAATPRTDAIERTVVFWQLVEFAQQLERELAEARSQLAAARADERARIKTETRAKAKAKAEAELAAAIRALGEAK